MSYKVRDPEEVAKEIIAPFTPDQIASLNSLQVSGWYHPYTCGNDDQGILIATRDGWVCPICNYTQNWAWSFTADWSWDIGATDKQKRDREAKMRGERVGGARNKHPLRRFTTSEMIVELCKREGVSVAEWGKDRILLVKENEI